MMRLFVVLIAIIFVFPIFPGCKKGQSPKQTAKTTITEAQKIETTPKPIAQEATQVQEETYVYDPKGRRDPFVPLIKVTKKGVGKKGMAGTLESYDIGDFKLIAIVEKEEREYYGLLLAPDNKSYTVRKGSVVGLHKGKVEKIMPDKLVIIEYIEDYKGELRPRQIVLELRKGEVEE